MNAHVFEPDGRHYRFSVKCDRERFHDIEKAAARLRVTVNQFVQDHFDGIIEVVVAPPPAAPELSPEQIERDEAKSIGITVAMLRLHRAMWARTTVNRHYLGGVDPLADVTGLAPTSIRVLMHKLVAAGLIRRAKSAGRGTCAVYVVKSIGDVA